MAARREGGESGSDPLAIPQTHGRNKAARPKLETYLRDAPKNVRNALSRAHFRTHVQARSKYDVKFLGSMIVHGAQKHEPLGARRKLSQSAFICI